MPRQLDLNLLPVLIKVFDHGSVSAASDHLGMSQSAVSGALAKLRKVYSDPLFQRVSHGMQPTARMCALIDPLRDSVARMEATLRTEREFNPATSTFTFAMSDLGEMFFMPRMLRQIRNVAPGASVRTIEASATQIERGLEIGEIDLAVGYFPYLRDKSFMEKHLFFHSFICLLRADHPIKATTLSLAQFLSAEHAVVSGPCRAYETFAAISRSKKIQRRVALEAPHYTSIPFVISQSDLIVTVPHAVGIFVRNLNFDIRIAQPPMRTPRIELKLHWHRSYQRDPKNRWLRDVVSGLFTGNSDEWRI